MLTQLQEALRRVEPVPSEEALRRGEAVPVEGLLPRSEFAPKPPALTPKGADGDDAEASANYGTPLPSSGQREGGKLAYQLVPAEFNLLLASILDYGAQKYAPHNFEKGMDPDDLLRGAEAHFLAIKAGAIYDPESGLPHAGHAAWNLLTFAMQMMREPSLEELFVSVVERRRAGNLLAVTQEYAAKHNFAGVGVSPTMPAIEWHERVAAFRGLIKQPPKSA